MRKNRGIFILAFSIYLLVVFFPPDPIIKRILRFLFVYAIACFYDCKLISLKQIAFFIFLDWGFHIFEFYATRDWVISIMNSFDPEIHWDPNDHSVDVFFLLGDLSSLWIAFFYAWRINRKLKLAERVGHI